MKNVENNMSNAKPVLLRLIDNYGNAASYSDLNFMLVSMLFTAQSGLAESHKIEYSDRVIFEIKAMKDGS